MNTSYKHFWSLEKTPACQVLIMFIKVIYLWWTITNVKRPHKRTRLHNMYATALTNALTDDKYVFLHKFRFWLDLWNNIVVRNGKLSRETFTVLKHTLMQSLNNKILWSESGMKYIVPGKFWTYLLDNLFYKYRRFAGCNCISLREVSKCKKTEANIHISEYFSW